MTKGVEISDQDQEMMKLLSSDISFYRVMWYPYKPRFAYYSDERPFVLREDYKSLVKDFDWYADQSKTDIFWDLVSIRYVIIPPSREVEVKYNPQKITTEIDGFRYYGDRNEFISRIQKLNFLTQINGPDGYIIYENKGYLNNLYFSLNVPSLEQQTEFINPDYTESNWEYHSKTIDIKSMSNPFYLTFNNVYSPFWVIRTGNVNLGEALFDSKYFLDSKYHIHNGVGGNTFFIDPQILCDKSGNNYCKLNPDGSYDIKLTLYYKPMILTYLGGIVSITTVSLLLMLIALSLYKKREW